MYPDFMAEITFPMAISFWSYGAIDFVMAEMMGERSDIAWAPALAIANRRPRLKATPDSWCAYEHYIRC
jgi:hypothetical protein